MNKTGAGIFGIAGIAIGAMLYLYKISLLKLWWYQKFKQEVVKEFGRQYLVKTIFVFDSLETKIKDKTTIQTSFKAKDSFYMYKATYSSSQELIEHTIYEIDLEHALLWNQDSYWGI